MTTIEATLAVGDAAPDLQLAENSGRSLTLSGLWGERPLALVFLGPLNVQYSADQALQLRDAHQNFEQAGAALLAVSVDPPEEGRAFCEEWNIKYAVCADQDERAYAAFGVSSGLPGSFVIDTDGVVRFAHRNRDLVDNPSTWALVDAVSALTGRTVEKPDLTNAGADDVAADGSLETALLAPAPDGLATLNYTCAKCGNIDYEVLDVSTSSGMLSRLVNFQNRRFSAVTCRRCSYTEFYRTESGALRNVFDLLAGA